MLYPVEIRREEKKITELMAGMRQWLDSNRYEPDTFRHTVTSDGVVFRVEFKNKTEAAAFAAAFDGTLFSEAERPDT